ncbi:hypothetical protein [Streptomyces demainii]|uniref:Uncharacterized protein n=1 Tax=Streptomyces demainii TaxID=588122 RepID=A0ABT9L9N5_9ACTN|nr:hypothetical protein [Streptomyces demainii]MDP9616492.1 hypothetical protein [Streptomyces demainii]
MGKAVQRGRAGRSGQRRRRPIALTFCDVDYERGSRAHGRGVAAAPPEGWLIGRAGLVHADFDGTRLRITGDELITGPCPASALINALHGKQLVVGHGILTTDLRAAAMVTPIPGQLLDRTIDTLALAHRVRAKPYPAGCGLADLAERNLGVMRDKAGFPASAPGLRPGAPGQSPDRRGADPREDAGLVARLWEAMVTTGTLAWGAGRPSWTRYDGNTRPGSPAGAADLGPEHIAELTGRQHQAEAAQWASRIRTEGRIMRPTAADGSALLLANLAAAYIPAPEPVRIIADTLRDAGEIPPRPLQVEDLYMACQYLGVQQNIEVRHRSATGRKLTKALREPVAWALWQLTHPQWRSAYRLARRESEASAVGYIRFEELKNDRARIRGRLAALVQ